MTEQKLDIPVILGTGRADRVSEACARYVMERVAERGHETELIDPRMWASGVTIPDWVGNDHFKAWRERAARADGFIIVSPEYNHGYPGELKILLDSASDEYLRKPVGLCGVSSGAWGGVRMVEQLRLVCLELGFVCTKAAAYFPMAEKFDSSSYDDKRLVRLLDEVEWLAGVLKAGRNT